MLSSVVVEVVDGQVHAVVNDGRRRLDDPRCNLDDTTRDVRVVPFPAIFPPVRLCGHCFDPRDVERLPTTRDGSEVILDARFR